MIRTYRTMTLMAVAFAIGACAMNGASSDGISQQTSGSQAQKETGAHMKAQDPSREARLLGFLNVANKGDLEGGRLAEERGESTAVKNFGRQMEVDHMQMLQESEAAATRLGLVPAMGPEAQPLIQQHERTMQKLKASSGKNFDRVYLSHEVEMHQRVLETVSSLSTGIQNAQLTEMVRKARPILEAHLNAAQHILAEY